MIKLYNRSDTGIRYHEAWVADGSVVRDQISTLTTGAPQQAVEQTARLVAACCVALSPVKKYRGLARRHLIAGGFLMRPLFSGGTLGGRRHHEEHPSDRRRAELRLRRFCSLR